MRISTRVGRGTYLSLGPVGWLIVGPVLLAVYAAVMLIYLLMLGGWSVVQVCQAVAADRRAKRALQ